MNRIVLQDWVLDELRVTANEALRQKVAFALDISAKSVPRLLYGNDRKLTQAAVLKVLRQELKAKDKDLLQEIQISVVA